MRQLIIVVCLLFISSVVWAGDGSYTIIPMDKNGCRDYNAPRTRVDRSSNGATIIYKTEPGSSIYRDQNAKGQYIDESTGRVYETYPGSSIPNIGKPIGQIQDGQYGGSDDNYNDDEDDSEDE